MTINKQILNWAKSLPKWQNDLIRRLYCFKSLDEDNLNEVVSNIFYESGDLSKSYKVQKLEEQHIPNNSPVNTVKILSIKNLQNIAAIDKENNIDFEPKGLTIIYGDNSAGKSSYAKVLKQACRAIDDKIKIHANVYKSGNETGTADIVVDHPEKGNLIINRIVNTPPEPLLSSISIFDSDCAKIYSTEENTVSFIPSELKIFDSIVTHQTKLKEILSSKKQDIISKKPSFPELKEESSVKKFISGITYKTKEEEIKKACFFSEEDKLHLQTLEKDIATILANDPKIIVSELQRNINDAKILETALKQIVKELAPKKIDALLDAQRQYLSNKETAKVFTKEAFLEVPLTVGSNPWKNLWHAALEYHKTVYPSENFPFTGEESYCLLCQQELDEDTKNRLQSFEKFVSAKVNQEVKQSETYRDTLIKKLKELPFEKVKNASIRTYIAGENLQIDINIEQFYTLAQKIVEYLLRAERNEEIIKNEIPVLAINPLPSLEDWILKKQAELERTKELALMDNHEKLFKEKNELVEKSKIGHRISDVYKLVDLLIEEFYINNAIKVLDTSKITRKHNELTNLFVTAKFKEQIQNELMALDSDHIMFKINSRGVKGKTTIKINLDSNIKVNLNEILSEGEQKLISLAFFLAETSAIPTKGGILLDDPVSSLDHGRRDYVSKRLVQESKKRQVIIFTHDIVFMNSLQYYADIEKVNFKLCTIRRMGLNAGIAANELPWIAQTVPNRVKSLRNQLQNLKTIKKTADSETYRFEVKKWYMLLREAWERSVEELLFNGAIQRLSPSVQTQRLRKVKINEDLLDKVEKGMTNSSLWVHDQSSSINNFIPSFDEMEKDLNDLDNFKKQFK